MLIVRTGPTCAEDKAKQSVESKKSRLSSKDCDSQTGRQTFVLFARLNKSEINLNK